MTTLSKRLQTVADLAAVRLSMGKNRIAADVGTDHASIPLYLAQKGAASRIYATDIHEGPVKTARANIARAGACADVIDVRCTDGLHGLEDCSLDCVIIAGMGGEMIARILDEAPFVCKEGVSFVLQPQTREQILRRFLWDSGITILSETVVYDAGRDYVILLCEYRGIKESYTPFELYFGKVSPGTLEGEAARRFTKKLALLRHNVAAREMSESPITSRDNEEKAVLNEAERRLLEP